LWEYEDWRGRVMAIKRIVEFHSRKKEHVNMGVFNWQLIAAIVFTAAILLLIIYYSERR